MLKSNSKSTIKDKPGIALGIFQKRIINLKKK